MTRSPDIALDISVRLVRFVEQLQQQGLVETNQDVQFSDLLSVASTHAMGMKELLHDEALKRIDEKIGRSEVAKMIGIGAKDIDRQVEENGLPAYRIQQPTRDAYKFKRSEIEKWLKERKINRSR